MMFKLSSFFFAALLSSPAAVSGLCFENDAYDGPGDLNEDVLIENFRVEPGADTICTVRCESGTNVRLTLRYGEKPGMTALGWDAQSSQVDCQGLDDPALSLTAKNGDEREGILGYRIEANTYDNLLVSCRCTDSYENLSRSACFSKDSKVQVQGVGSVPMINLNVGDMVLTGNGKYESVYAFGHYNAQAKTKFLQLHTKNSKLEMTGNHLVYKDDEPVRADMVKVGDSLSSGTVTKITTVVKKGLFMPLTKDGTIVVDGNLASTYVSIAEEAPSVAEKASMFVANEHALVHWWLAPYRMLCLGVSNSFCNVAGTEDGILNWLNYGKSLAEFADNQHSFWQYMMGIPLFFIFAFFNVTEMIFGTFFAPSAVVFLTGAASYAYGVSKTNGNNPFSVAKKVV